MIQVIQSFWHTHYSVSDVRHQMILRMQFKLKLKKHTLAHIFIYLFRGFSDWKDIPKFLSISCAASMPFWMCEWCVGVWDVSLARIMAKMTKESVHWHGNLSPINDNPFVLFWNGNNSSRSSNKSFILHGALIWNVKFLGCKWKKCGTTNA